MNGDIRADFDAMREASKEKRARNRRMSAEMLRRYDVWFQSKNAGAHLIVRHGCMVVDFWPGTGLWIVRGAGIRSRGVRKLLRHLEVKT